MCVVVWMALLSHWCFYSLFPNVSVIWTAGMSHMRTPAQMQPVAPHGCRTWPRLQHMATKGCPLPAADLKVVNMLMAVLVPASAGPYACFDLASVGLRRQCSDATCRVDVKEGT